MSIYEHFSFVFKAGANKKDKIHQNDQYRFDS